MSANNKDGKGTAAMTGFKRPVLNVDTIKAEIEKKHKLSSPVRELRSEGEEPQPEPVGDKIGKGPRTSLQLRADVHMAVRIYAINNGTTLNEVISNLVEAEFKAGRFS